MKILIYSPTLSYRIWGTERVIIEQIKWLIALWHQIWLLTTWSFNKSEIFNDLLVSKSNSISLYEILYNNKQIEQMGEYVIWDRDRIYKESEIFALNANVNINSIVKNYDLTVTHMALDSLFIPKTIPNILHLHWHPSKKISVLDRALKIPKKFVAVANSVSDRRSINHNLTNISVCQNGIDLVKFKWSNRKRDIDVLFVWRFIDNKGIDDLLKAYKASWKVVMVWDWPLKQDIQSYASGKNIKILSNIPDNQLLDLYQRAKVFACPSTNKEGVLTTMLEAAACGCAIVTTNCCWMVDFAINKKNSLTVSPHNSEQLKLAIEILLKNDVLRNKLIRVAQEDLINNWSWNKKIKELESIYFECIINN